MLFFCIRHAESSYNAEGRIQGQSDPPLSPEGEKQAAALADFLARSAFDAVYTSPLKRSADTARPVAEKLRLELITDRRLMELDVGIFQHKTWAEVEAEHPDEAARWRSRDPDYQIPRGESRRMLMARAKAAFESIRQTGMERVIVVAHGGTLTAAFKSLLGIPAELNPISLLNASISQLHWPGNGDEIKLLSLNEIDHLRQAGAESRRGDLG
jgi:probable phosphoglycerate mutase